MSPEDSTTADTLAPCTRDGIRECVRLALREDMGDGDLTAQLVPADARATATVICREPAVLCGTAWFDEVFHQLDPALLVEWKCGDGQAVAADTLLCRLQGSARTILSGERTALNFLQTLSATATVARQYARAVGHTDCRILDTRKTIPGLRTAQKYATRCGGASNHRIGLFDGILIKENHIIACGGIEPAVAAAREQGAELTVEVEVENLEEMRAAVTAGADMLLLDNFSIADLRRAVELNRSHCAELGREPARLEASGNITEAGLAEIAATGVDFISIGALTKHVRAIDLSMRFQFAAE